MSVTFSAVPGPTTGFIFSCVCDGAMNHATAHERYDSHADAWGELLRIREQRNDGYRPARPGCDEPDLCLRDTPHIMPLEKEKSPSVNMSNANARFVLEPLGLVNETEDLYGTEPAQAFLGRVSLALALAPSDEGATRRTRGRQPACDRHGASPWLSPGTTGPAVGYRDVV